MDLSISNYKYKNKYLMYLNNLYNLNKELFYKKVNEVEFYDKILFDFKGYNNIFVFLLNKYKDKININLQGDYGGTILHLLIWYCEYDLFKEVLLMYKDKFDINSQNVFGDTVLYLLIKQEQYDLFKEVFDMFKDGVDDELYNYCVKNIKKLGI
jgi:ankyrin repeat protein